MEEYHKCNKQHRYANQPSLAPVVQLYCLMNSWIVLEFLIVKSNVKSLLLQAFYTELVLYIVFSLYRLATWNKNTIILFSCLNSELL